MLRTLGSTLVAKASPGAKFRDITEQNINSPELPGKGIPGSLDRAQIEEPLQRQTPPGSQKMVSVQPTVEAGAPIPGSDVQSTQKNVVPPVALTGSIGLPQGTPNVPSGAQNQPLLRSMASPGQAVQGRGATVTGMTSGGAAKAVSNSPAPSAVAPQPVAAPVSPQQGMTLEPWTSGILGLHAFAGDNAPKSMPRNTSQMIANKAADVVSTVAGKNNSVATGLRSYANDPQVTLNKTGSISGALGALDQFVRDYIAPNYGTQRKDLGSALRSTANNVFSGLRSLLGR